MPYIIETRDSSGYYKSVYDKITTDAAEWKISSANNFDNHEDAKSTDETEPALEPGDHGSLEFRVSPQSSDTLTVDCLFDIKAYVEEDVTVNGESSTTVTEVDNSTLAGYLEGHIMLFSGYDEASGKYTGLIDNDNETLKHVLEDQTYRKGENTYTTIYWYWPEHLSALTDSEKIIYDPDERTKVFNYIARNKDKFFKDCKDSSDKVLDDLNSLYNEGSNQLYNHYNLKYDNADLMIGNNISYVMLSMQVKQDQD